MKRTDLALIILNLLLFLAFTMPQTTVKANKNVLQVPINYPTIQDAINHANPGDIIYVYNGTYHENIVINKSIALIGQGIDLAILDGNRSGSVITITAKNVTVTGFTIKNSGMNVMDSGVLIGTLSTNNVIAANKIISNNNGIWVYASTSNIISNNVILNNCKGIALYSSTKNVLINNTISKNIDTGIEMFSSNINTILGNTISFNECGMLILSSSNNAIYHNNFVDNHDDVQILDSFVSWNHDEEGNYWSKYLGQDLNQDGIGDTLHVITEGAEDPYPLMGMFFSFRVSLKGKEYYINIIYNSSILSCTFRVGETGSTILCLKVIAERFSSGFIRCALPIKLMSDPLIVLIDDLEVKPNVLNISNMECKYIYIMHSGGEHTIEIISSTVLGLYNSLLDENEKLKSEIYALNMTYQDLLEKYTILSANYSELQENYAELNDKYQECLKDYQKNTQNVQNLTYTLMTLTGAFLATIVYLSRQTHLSVKNKKKNFSRL